MILEANELYRFYHSAVSETAALRGVSFAMAPGEMVAVMGPSGSGKSTLLNCLAGLDEPDGGHVNIAGERLTRRPEAERAKLRARHIGVLLQAGNLFEHLTVGDNIRLQMRLAGLPEGQTVRELLGAMGVAGREAAVPGELSGGETARAGLAVALAAAPGVLLADEPTAEVDGATEAAIIEILTGRSANGGATLVVTHSAAVAKRADRVIHLQDGKIVNA